MPSSVTAPLPRWWSRALIARRDAIAGVLLTPPACALHGRSGARAEMQLLRPVILDTVADALQIAGHQENAHPPPTRPLSPPW